MENKIAVIGIIVENRKSVPEINRLLSDFGDYIIGRMGIPYHKRDISIISVAIDAPKDKIEKLTEKLSELEFIQVKTTYENI